MIAITKLALVIVIATVAIFAIGAAATNVNAQPSNFTINTSNMTAGSAVLNCANGRSLTMADINKGQTCSNTTPTVTPTPIVNNSTVTPAKTQHMDC
ncbi:MAG: hypothetical protein M3P08_01720 [Thermoproteota archaeon]|nr:hypothetical protein [Thermoproteota archaeon]